MASPKHHAPAAAAAKNKQHARTTTTTKRPLVLRRAMLHSCVCFLVGLVTGFAPSEWTDAASRAAADANAAATAHVFRALNQTATVLTDHQHIMYYGDRYGRRQKEEEEPPAGVLVVVVTTTAASERERRSAGLTRTAHALRLVSPPVVWLVVEAAREAGPTARLLRRTAAGVAYRHLTYRDNFTSSEWEEERHRQRNQALGHIEQHRLRGVVFFAGLADVYDIRLLEQLRHSISSSSRRRTSTLLGLGAWPVATVWAEQDKRRVAVEGPLVVGNGTASPAWWFTSSSSSGGSGSAADFTLTATATPPVLTDDSVHGFAFASDLLWDPARWDRFSTSEPDQSQDSIKFVQRLVVADYNKTRPVVVPDYSNNCSQIMAWRVDATLL